MATSARRGNNWGPRRRVLPKHLRRPRVRTPRTETAALQAERHARWAAVGTFIGGIAGALGLLVSAGVAYQGVLAWRDQTEQNREAAEVTTRAQVAKVGVWTERNEQGATILVFVNRSLDALPWVGFRFDYNTRGVDQNGPEGVDNDVPSEEAELDIGVVPPCLRLEIGYEAVADLIHETLRAENPGGPVRSQVKVDFWYARVHDVNSVFWDIGAGAPSKVTWDTEPPSVSLGERGTRRVDRTSPAEHCGE